MPKIPTDEEPHPPRPADGGPAAASMVWTRTPFAVSLAKLSIWLVTLAKDHAFTFHRPRAEARRLPSGPDEEADRRVPLEAEGQ